MLNILKNFGSVKVIDIKMGDCIVELVNSGGLTIFVPKGYGNWDHRQDQKDEQWVVFRL